MGFYAIRLSVLWINRLCKPANPAFTMSKEQGSQTNLRAKSFVFRRCRAVDAVSEVGVPGIARGNRPDFAKWLHRAGLSRIRERSLVEPIGIEPTTSSLQSSRSPN
jgi:hypothetical protein